MALTGIEIYKKLPKTNCGKCGVPTCLAFAMQLAAGKAELEACPFVTEETKAELSEASAPPVRVVVIGTGEKSLKIGGETVMFRHEKTFVNPAGIGILIKDTMEEKEIEERILKFNTLQYKRVGLTLKPDAIAIKNESNYTGKFEALVNKIKDKINGAIILMSSNAGVLSNVAKSCQTIKPLIYAADKNNIDAMAEIAKENSCPLAVRGENLDELAQLTTKLTSAGLKDLVLDSGARTFSKVLEDQIIIRRLAILKKFRPLGFPTITFPCEMTTDPMEESLIASTLVAKYAGIIILSDLSGESLFPLLVARMNIFTDPQRPMATTEGIYPIGGPDENSPLLVTTNFSLTYFIVSGEIESSRVPSWLLVQNADGLSVLTAWAANKFGAETIAALVKKSGITEKIKHKKIIIPGAVARISGELEEELPGWEVIIGPREAAHLPVFLRQLKI